MRTISTAQAAVRASGSQADHFRVWVKDAGGTFRDLTTYPGFNAVDSYRLQDSVGSPHMTCDVVLKREQNKLSLSPYVGASAINRGFNPSASPVALLAIGRAFKVEVAITAADRAPGAGDWMLRFEGRIDYVDPAAGETLRFGGRDKAGRIADQQIQKERVYGFAQVAGVAVSLRPWEPGMTVATGERMLPATTGSGDSGAGRHYVAASGGTTGNSEPTWTTGSGISDGTVSWNYVGTTSPVGRPVEEVQQNLLDDNRASGDPAVTLYVPSSPGWAITQFTQSRDRNLQAIRALAQQIGWDVRSKWHSGTSQFELTLWEPERSKTTPDYSFGAADYLEPTRLETAIDNIRNKIRVPFSDTADRWPDGSPKRKVIEVADSASIAKYGEMWMEIAEASASNVNTPTEATALANAALSDCAEPTADFSVPLAQAFPWAELGDLYAFAADGRRFDSEQKFAVMALSEEGRQGKIRTELACRGKPGLAAWSWVSVSTLTPFVVAETQPPPRLVHYDGGRETVSIRTVQAPGGVDLLLAAQAGPQTGQSEYELHVSDVDGFTPDEDSFRGLVVDQSSAVHGLKPGKEYFARAVSRRRERGRLARGQPGAQVSFVAGHVGAGMLDRLAVTGQIPNGDFKANYDPDPENATEPPDHWNLVTGTFGPSGDVRLALDSDHGWFVSLRQTATNADLRSEVFRLQPAASSLVLAARVAPQGTLIAGRTLQFHVEFFTGPDGGTPIGDADVEVPYDFVAAGTWALFTAHLPVPAGAAYATVEFYKTAVSSAYGWDVAQVELTHSALAVPAWVSVAGSYASGWAATFGSADADMQYRVRGTRLELRGWATRASGTNTLVTTLPAEFRPATRRYFMWSYLSLNATPYVSCRVDVDVDGRVLVLGTVSGQADLSFDGIELDLLT